LTGERHHRRQHLIPPGEVITPGSLAALTAVPLPAGAQAGGAQAGGDDGTRDDALRRVRRQGAIPKGANRSGLQMPKDL
jgi:hypothetical protein